MRQTLGAVLAALGMAAIPPVFSAIAEAQRAGEITIDAGDIAGVVSGPNGPEAGVWVIAETTELSTKYAKMVVTDDEGRFLIPDLPTANYSVWARGYGLVDSPKVRAKPGQHLDLAAAPAPNAQAAAHYYPAIYWYSMLKMPPVGEFGGSGELPEKITLSEYLTVMKNRACVGCHQLGQESTRTIPAQFGEFPSGADAWARRVGSPPHGQSTGRGSRRRPFQVPRRLD